LRKKNPKSALGLAAQTAGALRLLCGVEYWVSLCAIHVPFTLSYMDVIVPESFSKLRSKEDGEEIKLAYRLSNLQ
jgi:hypothetical protein